VNTVWMLDTGMPERPGSFVRGGRLGREGDQSTCKEGRAWGITLHTEEAGFFGQVGSHSFKSEGEEGEEEASEAVGWPVRIGGGEGPDK